ncbi:MAG: cbb3-type cytochrome oxidase assembly protein CcoS [Flavobacteriaceae bacterium]|jgi:cbb3-type cytochrome oxidase maturation protein|nr:cbb3-type cytochrome oxidase assembly protein CcoS [Flavobacteriaceae bacterium]
MEVVYITIGVSVIIAIIFFGVFLMNLKKGQYEDVYTPSVRMLFDDEEKSKKQKQKDTINK